ncbi:MAG: hypothetical protein AB7N61_18300 [Acidimicrobiia bacterium]
MFDRFVEQEAQRGLGAIGGSYNDHVSACVVGCSLDIGRIDVEDVATTHYRDEALAVDQTVGAVAAG